VLGVGRRTTPCGDAAGWTSLPLGKRRVSGSERVNVCFSPAPRSLFAIRTNSPWRALCSLVLRKSLVSETIQPIFSRLSRRDHWMCRGPSVLTGVSIGRRIAAQRHAACLARTQVNPARSYLNALLALRIFRMLHRLNRADVDTALAIHDRPSFVHVRWIGQVGPSKICGNSYSYVANDFQNWILDPGFWMGSHLFS
jgi:hypothetical protein